MRARYSLRIYISLLIQLKEDGLNDVPGYLPPVQIDEVVRSGGIGRVIDSKNPDFKVGDLTFGFVGWQTHCVTKA